MTYANIDEDGYLLSLADTPAPGLIEIQLPEDCDLTGERIGCYRLLSDGTVTFDAAREALRVETSEATERRMALMSRLERTNDAVLAAVESLFSARDIVTLVTALTEAAGSLRSVLDDRAAIRQELAVMDQE